MLRLGRSFAFRVLSLSASTVILPLGLYQKNSKHMILQMVNGCRRRLMGTLSQATAPQTESVIGNLEVAVDPDGGPR